MKSDSEDDLKKRFKDLCLDLNLDKTSADEAWQSFQRIGINYTLEVSQLIIKYFPHFNSNQFLKSVLSRLIYQIDFKFDIFNVNN